MLELGQTRGLRDFGRKEDWEPPERRPPCPATPAWGGGVVLNHLRCLLGLVSVLGLAPAVCRVHLLTPLSFASPFCGGGSEPGEATDGELRQMQPSTAWRGPKWPHGGLSMAAFPGSLLFARSPAKSNFTPRDVEGNLRTRGPSPRDQRLLFAAAHG